MRATHVTPAGIVLILAAAGGVGSLILQLARSAGVACDLVRSLEDKRELVEEALRRPPKGELRPVFGQTYSLSRASDAHLGIEMRQTIGKPIFVPDS